MWTTRLMFFLSKRNNLTFYFHLNHHISQYLSELSKKWKNSYPKTIYLIRNVSYFREKLNVLIKSKQKNYFE